MQVPIRKAAQRHVAVLAATALLSGSIALARTPRPVANIAIPVPSGKAINLAQYRGKVIVLAMISMECATCQKSIPIFNRAQHDFGPRGLQVIVAAGDNNAQFSLGPFIERYRPTFPMGYLTTEQMIQMGDFTQKDRPFAPILLFIDRHGVVRQQIQGDSPFFQAEEAALRNQVQQLLLLK